VLEAGASGVAVMSGICSHPDPQAAARAYVQALNGVSMTPSTKLKNATIDVQVNGRPTQLLAGMTVADFLEQKGLHPNMVVVEHNGHILKRGQFTGVLINAGDVLEVVHFVGGG
jgi:thiamine biosynthesis protein ThiS